MCIVATGNPFDGMTCYGPFDSLEEAIDWAEKNCQDNWWVVSVNSPN